MEAPYHSSSSTATATATTGEIIAATTGEIIAATTGEIIAATAAINTNDDNTTTQNPQIRNSLRSLNKSSYKISKPPSRNPNPSHPNPIPNPSPQSQPPVYNIDKSNFREVVQKLTGSPSHRHPPSPPPRPPPAAAGTVSRLHRIRPPPLSNLSMAAGPAPSLSPLPPFPSVSAAAESPITAYMRQLRGGLSPAAAAPPLSPLGFGCSGSAAMMPTSPRLPLPSPR